MFDTALRPEEIKLWRQEHRRVEQAALARILGVPLSTLRQWEQRRYTPHPLLRFALAYLDEHQDLLPQASESRGRRHRAGKLTSEG